MTITNIVLELPINDLADIANAVAKLALNVKAVITISQEDCIKTYLHQKGIYSWLSQHVQGEYKICSMTSKNLQFFDNPLPVNAKPWHVFSSPNYPFNCPFSATIPVVIRFGDEADAILFKMTFVDKSD